MRVQSLPSTGMTSNPKRLPQAEKAFNPKFGNQAAASGPVKVRRLLERLDFTAKGASPVAQIGVIFSSLIIWRLLAANDRRRASVSKRWNELRENLMRDMLGFSFWFLGVPVLQRLYLGAVASKKPEINGILIKNMQDQSKASKGPWAWLKSHNPINNHYIPSSQQVRDQKVQALKGLTKGEAAFQKTEAAYENLIKHRNFATAIGLGSTILLLGVGINLLNFYLTRKNMDRNLQDQQGATASPVNPTSNSQVPFLNQRNAFPVSPAQSPFVAAPNTFRPVNPAVTSGNPVWPPLPASPDFGGLTRHF